MQVLRRENVEKPVKNVQMYDYQNCVFGSIEKPSQVKKNWNGTNTPASLFEHCFKWSVVNEFGHGFVFYDQTLLISW